MPGRAGAGIITPGFREAGIAPGWWGRRRLAMTTHIDGDVNCQDFTGGDRITITYVLDLNGQCV